MVDINFGQYDCPDLEGLASLRSLRTLRLDMNSVQLPLSLSSLSLLTRVYMRQNPAEANNETMTSLLGSWTALKDLSLCHMVDIMPVSLTELTAMTSLSLEFNQTVMPISIPQGLSQCPLLELRLQGSWSDDASHWSRFWHQLRCIPSLCSLDLSYNRLAHVPADAWAFGAHLASIFLSDCALTAIPRAVAAMTSLLHLQMDINLQTEVPPGPYLERLSFLDISCGTKMKVYPMVLLKAKSLRTLLLDAALRERERGNSTCPFSQHWLMRTCPCLSHLPN